MTFYTFFFFQYTVEKMYLHFDIHSAFTVPLFFLGTQLIINTYTQYYSTPLYPCILLSFLKMIFDDFRITLIIRVILCCVQQIQKNALA